MSIKRRNDRRHIVTDHRTFSGSTYELQDRLAQLLLKYALNCTKEEKVIEKGLLVETIHIIANRENTDISIDKQGI